MSKQLVVQVAFAVAVCVALVGLAQCGSDEQSEPTVAETPVRPVDPAARLASLVSLMDDHEANRETRITVARQVAADHPDEATRTRADDIVAELSEEIRVDNIGKQWSYSRDTDPMTSKVNIGATVQSTNTHNFSAPYGGSQRAGLMLRRHPTYGDDVIFVIEKGQILCHTYGDCPVRVRFDDQAPRMLRGNPPSDHSTNHVFIPGYRDFVRRLSGAKRVLVETNIYQEGAPAWEFDVEGFKPEQMQ